MSINHRLNKTAFLFLLAAAFWAVTVSSQPTTQPIETPSVHQVTTDSILLELRAIRQIQAETRSERARIWEHHKHAEAQAVDTVPSNEYGAMLLIADNTHHNAITDDWNLFGWVTFLIAAFSLGIGWVTYTAQKRTEEHTTNAPKEVQLWKLRDLPRHFYRNLVCTSALIYLHKDEGAEKKRKRYPSESNLWKLKTLPDDIVLPIDVDKSKNAEDNSYSLMHELKLLLRNYNVEVQVASMHLSRSDIADSALKQDFDNLLFKPLNLVKSTYDFEMSLHSTSSEQLVHRTLITILTEHFRKLQKKDNFLLLFEEKAKLCLADGMKPATETVDEKAEKSRLNLLAIIDKKGGVGRSLKGLLEFKGKKEQNVETSARHMMDSSVVITEVKKALGEKDAAFLTDAPKLPGVLSIGSEKNFEAFYHGRFQNDYISDKQLKPLYKLLAPYFDYLRQPSWDFHTLFEYILCVDAAIETDRIGMVNFE